MFRRAAILLLCISACGCAHRPREQEPAASSLVYSPAERLPPERDRSARASANEPPSNAPQSTTDDVRPPAGRRCRVHLRRDAMGVAAQAPYPLAGNNLAADRASVTGTLERVTRDWVVVRSDRSTHWLPRDAVLSIEFVEEK